MVREAEFSGKGTLIVAGEKDFVIMKFEVRWGGKFRLGKFQRMNNWPANHDSHSSATFVSFHFSLISASI